MYPPILPPLNKYKIHKRRKETEEGSSTITPIPMATPPSLYYICNLESAPTSRHNYAHAPPRHPPSSANGGGGGGGLQLWSHLYSTYGLSGPPRTGLLLAVLLSSAATSLLSSAVLLLLLRRPFLPSAAFAILSLPLLLAASSLLRSSLPLHFLMCQRVVSSVPDWSSVRSALDLGCGRGVLLASVASQLKKSGSAGRVVGLHPRRDTAVAALRAASAEGVGEYVTCREGDSRGRLPFADGHFDVVVSAVHLSEEGGGERGLDEAARVLRGGGWGVVWDRGAKRMVRRLREMGMEEIRVSERVAAYFGYTHIVSFRKPLAAAAPQPPVDWRATMPC